MRFLWLRFFLVLAMLSPAAHAQVGIYGNFGTVHLTNNSSSTTSWLYGPGVGVYYDSVHLGPIGLGGDVRYNQMWGNGLDYRSVLGGVRLSLKPPVLPIKPYVQGSAGVGGTKVSSNVNPSLPNHYANKFQYDVFGGVDYTLLPRIDWRVVEVGFGGMSGVSDGTPAPASHLVTVSSGIVIRLPF